MNKSIRQVIFYVLAWYGMCIVLFGAMFHHVWVGLLVATLVPAIIAGMAMACLLVVSVYHFFVEWKLPTIANLKELWKELF